MRDGRKVAFTQTFTQKPTYVLCVTQGAVRNSDEFIAWGEGVIANALTMGCRKVLLDNRDFRLEISTLDVITFASHLENQDAAQIGLRLAVLSSPLNPEISRVVETSMTNRSAAYRRFNSPEEAKEWLDS